MKLQGKKTGAVANFVGYIDQATPTIDLPTGNTMLTVRYMDAGVNCYKDYKTIAEFNKDWEDYAVEEPLIKDERIRRAVRAWVEIGKYEHIYYDRAYNRLADDYDFVHCIEFSIDPCPDAESGRCYTLTELCGSEE